MKNVLLRLLTVACLGLVLAACGRPEPIAELVAEPAASTPSGVAGSPEAASLPRSPAPEGASVAILQPHDGDVVSSPVTATFNVQGMTLAPAGDATPNTGHHHLLVDTPIPDPGQAIPKDARHLHFGHGEAMAEITLAPGQHTLQLLLADSNHVPHDPPVFSPPIAITVQ